MASIPPIPPLLCNTPPPIDFGEEDDSGLPPTLALEDDDDDDFGDFALAVESSEAANTSFASSLPPELSGVPPSDFIDIPPLLDEEKNVSIEQKSTPPPLDSVNTMAADKQELKPNEAFNFDIATNLKGAGYNSKNEEDISINPSKSGNAAVNQEMCSPAPIERQDVNVSSESGKVADGNDSSLTAIKSTSLPSTTLEGEKGTLKESSGSLPTDNSVIYTIPTSTVTIEDVFDDSSDDEELPPKSTLHSPMMDATSDEFFTIQYIKPESEDNGVRNIDAVPKIKTDNPKNTTSNCECHFSTTNNNNIEKIVDNENSSEHEFHADFSGFANVSAESIDTENIPEIIKSDFFETPSPPSIASGAPEEDGIDCKQGQGEDDEDDDFDDFQDFNDSRTEETKTNDVDNNSCIITEEGEGETKTCGSEDGDDFDDFGEFTGVSFSSTTPTPASNKSTVASTISTEKQKESLSPLEPQQTNTPLAINSKNIDKRLQPLLEVMFPSVKSNEMSYAPAIEKDEAKLSKSLGLESIDTAKALKYQWNNSNMRHAFIRSLGIDSRNILYGDNWNSSMPRYAANLSFNPLQPIKSQSSTSDCGQSDSKSAMDETSSGKVDVPAVEFDWQSSGLINPLEGPKEETNAREAETVHAPQPGELHASNSWQQSHPTLADDNNDDTQVVRKDLNGGLSMGGVTAVAVAAAAAESQTEGTATMSAETTSAGEAINVKFNNTNDVIEKPIDSRSENASDVILNNTSNNNINNNLNNNVMCFDGSNKNDDNEVVTTSIYAGPLKETHIYTPPKGEVNVSKTVAPSATSSIASTKITEPIDFDYEIAAAGIIIDETVVKKEYRDVEYNPGFGLEFTHKVELSEHSTPTTANTTAVVDVLTNSVGAMSVHGVPEPTLEKTNTLKEAIDEEFTEFQSVPPPPPPPTLSVASHTAHKQAPVNDSTFPVAPPMAVSKTKEVITSSRTGSPTIADRMILSPAILLPQAISIGGSQQAPRIEWGDSAANINPDELARIEELFPQPKSTRTKDTSSSQKSTPTRNSPVQQRQRQSPSSSSSSSSPSLSQQQQHQKQQQQNSLSISASIAKKENDDDYWSDFVYVSTSTTEGPKSSAFPKSRQIGAGCSSFNNNSNNNNNNNNINNNYHSKNVNNNNNNNNNNRPQNCSPMHKSKAMESSVNNCNEEEWSDFVSSTPGVPAVPAAPSSTPHIPSMPAMLPPHFRGTPQFNSGAWQNANYYNNPISFYHQNHLNQLRMPAQPPQQVHIMQDFSTAPPQATAGRLANLQQVHRAPIQLGSAKVAPSVSLIPDLGFIAPATSTHTAFINVLPKPNFRNSKK